TTLFRSEGALSAYKESYESNTDDLHSLRMIPRLIGMNGDGTEEKWQDLALPYIKSLAKQTNIEQYITDLIQYYYDREEWNDFHKWSEHYVDLKGDHLDHYIRGLYANALMKQKKLQAARAAFEKAMEMDDSNRFIGNWLAVELYLNESFEKVLDIAKSYPERPLERPMIKVQGEWATIITKLKKEGSQSEAYRNKLKEALAIYFKGNEKNLTDWIDSTEKPAIKEFIKALRKID